MLKRLTLTFQKPKSLCFYRIFLVVINEEKLAMNIIENFAGRTALRVRRFLKKTPIDLRLAVKEDIPVLVRLRLDYLKVERPEVNALKEGLLALSLGNYFMRHLSTGDLVCWVG